MGTKRKPGVWVGMVRMCVGKPDGQRVFMEQVPALVLSPDATDAEIEAGQRVLRELSGLDDDKPLPS